MWQKTTLPLCCRPEQRGGSPKTEDARLARVGGRGPLPVARAGGAPPTVAAAARLSEHVTTGLLKHRNSLQKGLCPVVICPYLCSSESDCPALPPRSTRPAGQRPAGPLARRPTGPPHRHNHSMSPCVHASMRPCVYASMRPCTHPFIHPSIRPSVRPSVIVVAERLPRCWIARWRQRPWLRRRLPRRGGKAVRRVCLGGCLGARPFSLLGSRALWTRRKASLIC